MTTEADPPLPSEERTQRHRLVPRAILEAQYRKRYHNLAVSAYGLAVREIVEACPEIGPIDTWQKLADRSFPPRPDRDGASRAKKLTRLRKKLSRHFTAESKGPPWQTVMLVVDHALPAELRREKLAQLADLYELARGEKPPIGTRDERSEEATRAQGGQDLVQRLRQRIAELERRELALMVEVSELRGEQVGQPVSHAPRSDELPRQREPLKGPPTGTPNTRHFPTSQTRTGDPAQGHYRGAPWLDTSFVALREQSRVEPPSLVDRPWHSQRPKIDGANDLRHRR
ncbi:hypothetical protein ACFYL6_26790 [Micromonospora sp. NPDC007208]|uniref:hypothetical protein n=1 Tax=Micromonospora sp. NPDC007208 TaxID=3364236 RepID=UPI00369A9287